MRARRFPRILTGILLCAGLSGTTVSAQTASPGVQADGSVTSPAFTIPYSDLASPEARAFFPKMIAAGSKAPPLSAPIVQSRAFYDRMNSDRVARMKKIYPVNIHAETIGIYGCSAGGVLTGEAVARIISKNLPAPGAIGTFCGSISELGGDSTYTAPVLNGEPPPSGPSKLADLPYFKGASASDPLVFPGNSPALLAKLPPTLLITGTRDFTMSSVIQSQRLLSAAGVDAELHVWNGMWHSFFSDPELPESREAYAVMVNFFNRKLGRQTAATAATAFAPKRSDRYSLDHLSPAAKP